MPRLRRLTRDIRWTIVIVLCLLGASTRAQAPPDLDTLLARVGARIADYYKRAQNVVCIEKTMVQSVDYDYSPRGFARVTEYELHVEADDSSDQGEAKVVRELVRVNGKPPRAKDQKDRAGCTDANPLSTEPLAFLLPSHRSEYTFASGGVGKGKDRNTFILEFTSGRPEGKGEIAEDPRGHEGCFTWSLPVVLKGRVWIDAESFQVVRVEQRMAGMADLRVSSKLQRKHNLEANVVVERHDTTIRYKTVPFHDPDEAMILPDSIDTLIVVRGGLESIRSRQTFTDYRRFLTAGRIVK
jgi:hypothetical protein